MVAAIFLSVVRPNIQGAAPKSCVMNTARAAKIIKYDANFLTLTHYTMETLICMN